MDNDWSGRHVRQRFELIVTSLLIAAFVFYGTTLKTSALLPIDFTNVPVDTVVLPLLFGFYAYTLVAYILRARTDRDKVFSSIDKVTKALEKAQKIDQSLKTAVPQSQTDALVKTIDEHLIFLRDVSARFDDVGQVKISMAKVLQELDQLRERYNESALRQAPDDVAPLVEAYTKLSEEMESMTATRYARAKDGVQKLSQLQALLTDHREFAEAGLNDRIDEANSNLTSVAKELKAIRDNLMGTAISFTVERIWFSHRLPMLVSLFLIAASIYRIVFVGLPPSASS